MNKNIKKYRMPGKKPSHRNAIVKSLVIELVRAEKIKTTPTKAKILKAEFDKLVTQAKKNNEASRRNVEAYFNSNEKAVNKLYKIVETKLGDRNSGYTHLIRTLPRKGDNADQMFVMVVNYEEKAKVSRVQKLLEKRKKTEESKSVSGRIKKAVKRTPKAATKEE